MRRAVIATLPSRPTSPAESVDWLRSLLESEPEDDRVEVWPVSAGAEGRLEVEVSLLAQREAAVRPPFAAGESTPLRWVRALEQAQAERVDHVALVPEHALGPDALRAAWPRLARADAVLVWSWPRWASPRPSGLVLPASLAPLLLEIFRPHPAALDSGTLLAAAGVLWSWGLTMERIAADRSRLPVGPLRFRTWARWVGAWARARR